jgi:hypothetical protein
VIFWIMEGSIILGVNDWWLVGGKKTMGLAVLIPWTLWYKKKKKFLGLVLKTRNSLEVKNPEAGR